MRNCVILKYDAMKSILLSMICLTSILGGTDLHGAEPHKTMDNSTHQSPLSKSDYMRGDLREQEVTNRLTPLLTRELEALELAPGSPVFIRIFKESRELELWVMHEQSGKYRHFKTWPIAAMSGQLGPKLAEGDMQAPEGFYYVARSSMKPDSRFHLAFNIGYPNHYDLAHARSGSFIMVHGNKVSIGCFAMTDPFIEEIYTLCHLALKNGQPFFRVHVFPFRMTDRQLADHSNHRWHEFWTNLKEGYDWFEDKRTPPDVSVHNKRYQFR